MSNLAENPISYQWQPIKDLPDDWQDMALDDLEALADIWQEQRANLRNSDALRQFNTRLQRQWAIETGIIENLYTLDRGVTQLLIERGIDASLIPHGATDKPAPHVVDLIRDQQNVVEGLFDFVGQRRDLSKSYIKEIHQALTLHQRTVQAVDGMGRSVDVELRCGDWKTMPNNPSRPDGGTHQYCPPEHVESEMDRLVEMHKEHVNSGIPAEVEAVWLHHRFTQIHPFQDGNGRVARALATLVFLRAGWFPLVVVSEKHRGDYISALEVADQGDLSPLVGLFGRLEKSAFTRALSIGSHVIAERDSFRSLIASVGERFRAQRQDMAEERRSVLETAEKLLEKTVEQMHDITDELNRELKPLASNLQVSVTRCRDDSKHWFWNQVVDTANALDYYANLRSYHGWARLKILEERQVEIVVSLHPVGTEFLGIAGASAFIEYRSQSPDEETKIDGPYPLTDDLFQFSYKQAEGRVMELFEKWLNDVLLKGLDEWRRQL